MNKSVSKNPQKLSNHNKNLKFWVIIPIFILISLVFANLDKKEDGSFSEYEIRTMRESFEADALFAYNEIQSSAREGRPMDEWVGEWMWNYRLAISKHPEKFTIREELITKNIGELGVELLLIQDAYKRGEVRGFSKYNQINERVWLLISQY